MGLFGFLSRRAPTPTRARLRDRDQVAGARFEPKLTPEERAEVASALADGASVDELAEEYGVSPRTIRRVAAAAGGDDGAVRDPRRALDRSLATIQLEALENPHVREALQERALDKLLERVGGGAKERPLTEVEIARVRKHLEGSGFAIEPRQVVEGLRRRVADLEAKLDAVLKEKADLAERLVKAKTGDEPKLDKLIGPDVQQAFVSGLAGIAGGFLGVPVGGAPSAAPGPQPPAGPPPVVAVLHRMDPAVAAGLLLKAAAAGAALGGVDLRGVLPWVTAIDDVEQLAAVFGAMPGTVALAADVRERPDWWRAFLAATRQPVGAQPGGPAELPAAPPASAAAGGPPGAQAAARRAAGRKQQSAVAGPVLPDDAGAWPEDVQRVARGVAGKGPAAAAAWLRDWAAADGEGARLVGMLTRVPRALVPSTLDALLKAAEAQRPAAVPFFRWLRADEAWLRATVDELRGAGAAPAAGPSDAPDADGAELPDDPKVGV